MAWPGAPPASACGRGPAGRASAHFRVQRSASAALGSLFAMALARHSAPFSPRREPPRTSRARVWCQAKARRGKGFGAAPGVPTKAPTAGLPSMNKRVRRLTDELRLAAFMGDPLETIARLLDKVPLQKIRAERHARRARRAGRMSCRQVARVFSSPRLALGASRGVWRPPLPPQTIR